MLASLLSVILAPVPKVPTLLVLNKGDDTVSLINLDSGVIIKKLPTGPNPNEVAVSPDGTLAAISDMGAGPTSPGKTITLVDIAKAEVLRTVSVGVHEMPHGITWRSKEELVFTSHATDSLVELNVKLGKIGRVLPTEQKGTHLAVFDGGWKRAYAVNAGSGSVTAFDFKSGKVLRQIPTGNRAEGISISPDGKWVACGNVGGNSVSIIDTAKLEVVHTIADVGAPIRTTFTPDGANLVVSSIGAGALEVYSAKNWAKVATVDLKQKPIADARYGNQWPTPMNFWALKNGRILVALVTSHAVAEVDPKTWRVTRTFDTGPVPDGIAVSE